MSLHGGITQQEAGHRRKRRCPVLCEEGESMKRMDVKRYNKLPRSKAVRVDGFPHLIVNGKPEPVTLICGRRR